jgi:hypothetical protein
MTQTAVTPQTPVGPFPASVGALALDLVWSAADTTNGNKFTLTGREVLLIQNSGGSSYTVTLTSAPDADNRTNDVSAYALAAGDVAAFSFRGGVQGWKQSDGTVHFIANNAAVKFAVLTFPT